MANEDKKDFNAMLHDSKDMPKFQTITDQKSIEKYGGSRMYFARRWAERGVQSAVGQGVPKSCTAQYAGILLGI